MHMVVFIRSSIFKTWVTSYLRNKEGLGKLEQIIGTDYWHGFCDYLWYGVGSVGTMQSALVASYAVCSVLLRLHC